jgi:hypothetical protein
MSSSIDSKFLVDLLAFPADTLDKKTIQYIFNMCGNKSTSTSSTDDKPKKTRKSKSKDENKEADETKSKTKRGLNDTLAARNAYWATKKAEGMSYKEFNALWKSMTDDEKKAIKAKYSPSASKEPSSAENTDNDEEYKQSSNDDADEVIDDEDDITMDDIDAALEKLKPIEKKEEEKKVASTKAKKTNTKK